MPSSRRQARDARSLRVKDGRPQTEHERAQQQRGKTAGARERRDAEKHESHSREQRVGLRTPIREMTNQRLKNGRRQLKRQRDEPDVREVQSEPRLQQRIDRRQHRLNHVIQQVRQTDRKKNSQRGAAAS
jgi:hypothetical protein